MKKGIYVVSADIRLLLSNWAEKRGLVLPTEHFFTGLRQEFIYQLKKIFRELAFVSEEELTVGIKQLIKETGLMPVSLDRVYLQSKFHLDITRLVDYSKRSCGLGNHFGSPAVDKQFDELTLQGMKEVALVDDVIFSGDLAKMVVNSLEKRGIKVPVICAGIGVDKRVNVLKKMGLKVSCVMNFQHVIDEVCERVFYPGVPLSGRSLLNGGNVGIHYVLPFGNPIKWASIPRGKMLKFSRFCILNTIILFRGIEKASNKSILCQDLERKVFSLPTDDTPFVEALKKSLYNLAG